MFSAYLKKHLQACNRLDQLHSTVPVILEELQPEFLRTISFSVDFQDFQATNEGFGRTLPLPLLWLAVVFTSKGQD
jgi:hypothetical protein